MKALLRQGRDAILLKEDLADAFRHVPVAICDRWLLGFQWLEIFYMEAFLPFGLRTAPFIFDLFARALHWILARVLGWSIVLHYLDDFFTIFPSGTDPEPRMAEWRALCLLLGIQTNAKKEEWGTSLEFLDILLDSIKMEARLPEAKLTRAKELVATALKSQHLLRHDLEVLVSFLAFCAKVVVPGRSFLTSLHRALGRTTHYCNIDKAMREDLLWWHEYLPQWNGVKIIRSTAFRSTSHLWIDASGNWGTESYWLASPTDPPHEVFSRRFSTRQRQHNKHRDIQLKEMEAVLHGMRLWLDRLRGAHLTIHCDNQAVCYGLTSGAMRGKAMIPLRQIVMLMALHDILISVVWLDSKSNHLADLLSRGRYDEIADEYSQLHYLTLS